MRGLKKTNRCVLEAGGPAPPPKNIQDGYVWLSEDMADKIDFGITGPRRGRFIERPLSKMLRQEIHEIACPSIIHIKELENEGSPFL